MSNFNGYCTNCIYCQKTGPAGVPVGVAGLPRRPSDAWICTENAVSRDPVSGIAEGPEMIPCVYARKPETGRCGPEGRLFKKA